MTWFNHLLSKRRHINWPLTMAYCLMGLGFTLGLARVQQIAEVAKDLAVDRQIESVLRGRANCEAIDQSNRQLRRVINLSFSDTTVDYTKAPEFQALDQKTKNFLVIVLARSRTPDLKAQLLEGLEPRDCVKEYPIPAIQGVNP